MIQIFPINGRFRVENAVIKRGNDFNVRVPQPIQTFERGHFAACDEMRRVSQSVRRKIPVRFDEKNIFARVVAETFNSFRNQLKIFIRRILVKPNDKTGFFITRLTKTGDNSHPQWLN